MNTENITPEAIQDLLAAHGKTDHLKLAGEDAKKANKELFDYTSERAGAHVADIVSSLVMATHLASQIELASSIAAISIQEPASSRYATLVENLTTKISGILVGQIGSVLKLAIPNNQVAAMEVITKAIKTLMNIDVAFAESASSAITDAQEVLESLAAQQTKPTN